MECTQYPRPGQRLAPATLRDFLQAPLPARYQRQPADATLRLCDLDESAWRRFDAPACRELGTAIVQAVSRWLRMPLIGGDRPLPPLPAGQSLADLALDSRTRNSLSAAGLFDRPNDLREMTLERVLGLRGFWAKSLVDLLVALEHAAAHPQHLVPAGKAPPPAARRKSLNRFPRPQQRLAPWALREMLNVPLPAALVAGTALEGARLCSLDEKTWDAVSPETVARLGRLVVERVSVRGANCVVAARRLPRPPKGLAMSDLRLENRTVNCLRQAGVGDDLAELPRWTVGRLLSLKAFGAKCLVDLLCALESSSDSRRRLDAGLTAAARALSQPAEVAAIPLADPRLGPELHGLFGEACTVGQMAASIAGRPLDPPDPAATAARLRQFRQRVDQLRRLPLETELMQIFCPGGSQRDREIVQAYYGWDGDRGRTLEELGRVYDLSRERIRQICIRAVKQNRAVRTFAPTLDRALEFIGRRVPAPLERLQDELLQAGLLAGRMPLETVQQAARFLGRTPPFTIVTFHRRRLAVRADAAALPRLVARAAARIVQSFGVATLAELAAELERTSKRPIDISLIAATLELLPDFAWLDGRRQWFRLTWQPQHGLLNLVDKVLAVAPRIEVDSFRTAVARSRRGGKTTPPATVLLQCCRQIPGVQVQRHTIIAHEPRDWRQVLAGVERNMVQVLQELGPIMERGAFEEECLRRGMNRFSFNAVVMCSPLISKLGRSVYGLLGARADRRTLARLAGKRPQQGGRVLAGCGRTDDGLLYLAYRLSKAAISGGVLTVPARLKEQVRGRFSLLTSNGHAAGTMVSKNGCAWGLGPALRGQEARPGDHMLMLLDASRREARIRIGDASILGRFVT